MNYYGVEEKTVSGALRKFPTINKRRGKHRLIEFIVGEGTIQDLITLMGMFEDDRIIMIIVCRRDRVDMFDYLLYLGTVPYGACLQESKGSLFDRLLSMGITDNTAFCLACNNGEEERFNKLLYTSNINKLHIIDYPLDAAIKRNRTNIALLLISFGAMCHTQRCIEDAVKNNNLEITPTRS